MNVIMTELTDVVYWWIFVRQYAECYLHCCEK